MKIHLCSMLLLGHAMATENYTEFAKKRAQEGLSSIKANRADAVPGFRPNDPPEIAFQDYKNLEAAAQEQIFSKNESDSYAAFLIESAQNRPYMALDLQKDPIILPTQEALADPEGFLGRGNFNNRNLPSFWEISCEEGRAETTYACQKTLIAPTIHIEPAKYSNFWCRVNWHRPDDPSCQAKTYYNPPRMYEPEKVTVTDTAWSSTCNRLEALTKKGLCKLIKKHCPKGQETRDVVGTLADGEKTVSKPITYPCWQWKFVYACFGEKASGCESLRRASCEQIASVCIRKIGEHCVLWRQKFRCFKTPAKPLEPQKRIPIQLDTIKEVASYPKNQEMQEAISKLSMLKEIQQDLEQIHAKDVLPKIFKGSCKRCTIAFGGFSDCCGSGKGWGHSLQLTGCNGEEKDLAQRRARGLCVSIGVYCAEKVLGVCIRKKQSYCCFPSKLARILHEQGRKSLGISWGNAEHPNCEGFAPEQLASLNLDILNFEELYGELRAKTQLPDVSVAKRNLSRSVQDMVTSLGNTEKEGSD
ncbi:MAG: conjugal transfer protein TraN [Alphaproteobacteria bacterium]